MRGVGHLRFSPDGRTLVMIVGRELWIWDLANNKLQQKTELDRAIGVTGAGAIAWEPSGKRIAIGTRDSSSVWRFDPIAKKWAAIFSGFPPTTAMV